jgi:ATP-dependent Clp protease ATP-binding subunit ClpA
VESKKNTKHIKVQIKDEAIIAAELSERYITNRFLPDIDLMDEAASKTEWRLTLNQKS